jgi:agmatine deiminase
MTSTTTGDWRDSAGPDPADLGFSMPAEWATHAGCWMAWPSNHETFGGRLEEARTAYASVAQAIRRFEPVSMIANPNEARDAAELCGPDIEILQMEIDDSWVRDSGPLFLTDGRGNLAGTTFRFNAWGGKSEKFAKDAKIVENVLEHVGVRRFESVLFAEGGGIHVDGEGTILTTEQCFPNPNRNPGWSREEIERELCRALGAKKVIWLPGDPDDDVTDGHVDGVACFVRPGVVLVEHNPDTSNRRHEILKENARALEGVTDAKGRELELIFIEEAYEAEPESETFSRSYINFYLANGAVVVPGFGLPGDDRVRETLQQVFPDRQVVQPLTKDIAIGGGGIHCITQQQPL